MSTLKVRKDSSGTLSVEGDLGLLKEGWLRIEAMKTMFINEEKPWVVLTDEFEISPGPKVKQVYLRKMSERLQSHVYKGAVIHWGNAHFPVIMWYLPPNPNISTFKDEKS